MHNDLIYISDMMYLDETYGKVTPLSDRITRMQEIFDSLPPKASFRLLQYYPVNKIKECMEAYKDVARGVLFINPDGMLVGNFDSRTFTYANEEQKTVQIRL